MKRLKVICPLLAVIFLSSCGYYQHQSRMILYSQIMGTNDTLDNMTKEWHQLLNKAVSTGNFSYLSAERIRLAQFLSRNRSKVANLETTPNVEALRDSEVVFLSNQAAVISDVYSLFESNNELTPNDVVQGQLKTLGNDLENESAMVETIKQSLRSYAKKNGLNVPQ